MRSAELDRNPERSPKVPSQQSTVDIQAQDSQEGPPSPLSEASSGYFSHSVSTATLSEALAPGNDTPLQAGGQTPTASDAPQPALAVQLASATEVPVKSCSALASEGCPSLVRCDVVASGLKTDHTRTKDSDKMNGEGNVRSMPVVASSRASSKDQAVASVPTDVKDCPSASFKQELLLTPHQVISPGGNPLIGPEKLAPISEMGPSKSHALLDHSSQPSIATSPFKIQRVRPSELRSFSNMLGGEPEGFSGLEEEKVGERSKQNLQERGHNNGSETISEEKLEVISDSEEGNELPDWLKEGEYVTVGTNKMGTVRYVGPTDFQEGTWVGVELDLPSGECCKLSLYLIVVVFTMHFWNSVLDEAVQKCAFPIHQPI